MSFGHYYHLIPEEYCRHLGGLRWSANGDAVEYEDGTTFALVPEIGLFLEGLTSNRRLLHFGFVLHLLYLLGKRWPEIPNRCLPLYQAFQEAGRPLRNAGAFLAALCRPVPAVHDPFAFQPHEWMVQSSILWFQRCPPHEQLPPLMPETFEGHVLRRLEAYTPQELRHWLRHGRGPIKADGERLAREITVPKPRSLAEVLAELMQRERLAGAVPYVARLVSALALPPRRLARQELPMGGYSDVATRGQPEQILPSQLALDELEFVRRFASNELLFFRREEPQTQTKEELVLLLDQGVRCWGDVRLVLTAAVFALARRVARSKIALRMAATSSTGKWLDARTVEPRALGELLEASDLTAHPALALERVLEEPADVPRDIVLLTHPRSLAEADVQAAARRVGGNCRLFAVTVDGHGQAELSELRHGVAVPRTRFRIEWEKALPPSPPPPAPEAAPSALPWAGNVEPIGFPFRFGVTGPLGPFAFDQSGEWLLVSGPQGMLHVERTDGTCPEVLPRGFLHDTVLTHVETVLGVTDGFAVCGKIDEELVAFHYNLGHRTCTARIIGRPELGSGHHQWYYFPKYHAVVMKEAGGFFGTDLKTGERGYHKPGIQTGTAPILQACAEAESYPIAPPRVAIVRGETQQEFTTPAVDLNERTGAVSFMFRGGKIIGFTPLFDGRPLFKDTRLTQAMLCGDTLALVSRATTFSASVLCGNNPGLVSGASVDDPCPVRLLRLPGGAFLAEFPLSGSGSLAPFMLSPDGNKFARLKGDSKVIIHDLTGEGRGNWVTPRGKFHPRVELEAAEHWLAVSVGHFVHLVSWGKGTLAHSTTSAEGHAFVRQQVEGAGLKLGWPAVTSPPRPRRFHYDFRRFGNSIDTGLSIAVDAYGQVIILDQEDKVVCMFFVFRNQLAGWMPDGTRFGPAALTGGPQTADAAERIGRALLAAESGKSEAWQ